VANRDQIYKKSKGGITATHFTQEALPIRVAPSVTDEHNTIKAGIIPYACWKVEDMRFEFDSSIIKPDMADELQDLSDLIGKHTQDGRRPPASIFGHADPVGQDEYNKQLSGRRAKALYALLTRNVDMWEELYTQPFGGDSWREKKATSMMLGRLGYGDTDAEIRRFQQDQGLEVDGIMGPNTRKALYKAYMDAICPIKLDPQQDFLGRGQDPGGKADYQGCGEFNPLLLFSEKEEQEYSRPENREVRNSENAPNRRVIAFLFRPGTKVNPERWPCPRAKEGGADCRKRFWSDGERRRTERLPDERREYDQTKDTFACRFYDRMADESPCEQIRAYQRIRLYDLEGQYIPRAAYKLSMGEGKVMQGQADDMGYVTVMATAKKNRCVIDWGFEAEPGDEPYLVFHLEMFLRIEDQAVDREEEAKRKLNNLGYPPTEPLSTNVKMFQYDYGHLAVPHLLITGELDERTMEQIRETHKECADNLGRK
jgi:outer membrane protein OmpA-like peptidoglycan-associated protein